MSEHLLLAPLLESFFRRRLTKQRNATPATLASYRDALRMLILFAAAHLRKKPAALALDDLDRDLVLAFLDLPPGTWPRRVDPWPRVRRAARAG